MNRAAKITIVTALTLGLAGGVAAFGKHRHGNAENMAAHMVERISGKLDLNEDQEAALVALKDEILSIKTEIRGDEDGDNPREAIAKMITADQFDQSALVDMINTKADVMQRSSTDLAAAMGTFLDGLSAEQKAEIAEHMKSHRGKHRRGWHKRHGHDDDDHDRRKRDRGQSESDEEAQG